jgi:hypothetical protein
MDKFKANIFMPHSSYWSLHIEGDEKMNLPFKCSEDF